MAIENNVNRIIANQTATANIVKDGFQKDKLDDKNLKLQLNNDKPDLKKTEGNKSEFDLGGVKNKVEQVAGDKNNKNILGNLDENKVKSALVNAGFENNPKLADAVQSLQKGNIDEASKLLVNGISEQTKNDAAPIDNQLNKQEKESAPKEEGTVEKESKLFQPVEPEKGSIEDIDKKQQDPIAKTKENINNSLAAINQALQANLA
jgi:hypothetical protein